MFHRTITGDHSKYDQILLVKIAKYIGYRRFYLIWSPVILILASIFRAVSRHDLTLLRQIAVPFRGTNHSNSTRLSPKRNCSHQLRYQVPGTIYTRSDKYMRYVVVVPRRCRLWCLRRPDYAWGLVNFCSPDPEK